MNTDSLHLVVLLPAPPEDVFDAWISSEGHSAMTGAPASVQPGEGGRFHAWDGYIEGWSVRVDRPRTLVQRWRSSDFPEGAPDSLLELSFSPAPEGTRLELRHSEIPTGQGPNYEQGWEDFYFAPMRAWFGTQARAASSDK